MFDLSSVELESVGVRYGFPAKSETRGLQEAEMFSDCRLPWRYSLGDLEARLTLDMSLGWLGGHSENAFMGTVGPSLRLRWPNFPIELDGGSSPTFVSEHQFGNTEISTHFQFTSHAGINWEVTRHLRLGYRFTHMSNAGIKEPNPGLNMHVIGTSWLF